jgi:hypothetical protein
MGNKNYVALPRVLGVSQRSNANVGLMFVTRKNAGAPGSTPYPF